MKSGPGIAVGIKRPLTRVHGCVELNNRQVNCAREQDREARHCQPHWARRFSRKLPQRAACAYMISQAAQ